MDEPNTLYVERDLGFSHFVIKTTDLFETEASVLMEDIEDFEVKNNYLFFSHKSTTVSCSVIHHGKFMVYYIVSSYVILPLFGSGKFKLYSLSFSSINIISTLT